jgi:hypothetical protein
MLSFSAVDAALAGFRLAIKRPMLILAWTGLYVAAFAVIAVIAVLIAGPSFMSLAQMSDNADPAEALAAMSGLWLVFLLLVPVLLIFSAVFVGAIYRSILRPEEKKVAHVTLGPDEWRLVVVTLVYSVLGLVIGGVIVGVIVGATAVVGESLRGLVAFILIVAALCLGIWLGVRFSLVAAQTFAERKLNLFGSWALTRGRFWPMLGIWALTIVFAIITAIVVGVLSYIPLVAFGGFGALGQTANPDPSTMTAGIIIGLVFYGVVQMVGSIVQSVVTSAPAADAMRQLTVTDGAAEVFS